MSRIADLGEACDEGIKRLRELTKGESVPDDPRWGEVQLAAAREAIHAYFDYSSQGRTD